MTRKLFVFGALAALLSASAASAAGDAAAGKKTYDTLCITCHGPSGKGDGPAGPALTPPPRDFSVGAFKFDADKDGKPGTDADLLMVVKQGAGAFGGNPAMAPWGHMPEKDLIDVLAFVRSLKK